VLSLTSRKSSYVVVLFLAVGFLVGIPMSHSAAASTCDGTGRTWPGSGQTDMSAVPRPDAADRLSYSITMTFTMTSSEICQLQAYPYLELQYNLLGFQTAKSWDNYSVESNLPGGRHDIDFGNDPNKPTPAATAITPKDLVAGTQYHLTIKWSEPLQAHKTAQVQFNWVPSHLARPGSENALKCSTSYLATGDPAWCIFPVGTDKNGKPTTVTLFGSGTFQGGKANGIWDLTTSSFVWYPAVTGSPAFVVTSGSVPTPTPGEKLPIANFTYTRLTGTGNKISLDGSSSYDPDGSISSWTWVNGTAAVATGKNPTISLGAATSANITLTVMDNQGGTASITKSIAAGNRPPVITSTTPATGLTAGTNTPTLRASASDDDGDSLQYNFSVTGPAVNVTSGWASSPNWTVPAHTLDPGTSYTWTVQARDSHNALSSVRSSVIRVAMLPTAADLIPTSTGSGYWQVASDGGVFSYGDARFFGSLPGLGIHTNTIMEMARTPDDGGYWLVGTDGGVFAFGDAGFYGSLPGSNVHVNNIVGMAVTKTGHGYWLVGSDGGVFAYGDAGFHGSMGGKPLNAPVVAIAPTSSGQGYWLGAADGGVFAFGDAGFYGSMGGQPLNAPVTDIEATPDGQGYWLAAEDGGVFAYGDAKFFGSMAGKALNGHITGMAATPDGGGYWLNGCDGGVFAFGDAPFYGSNPTYQCRGVSATRLSLRITVQAVALTPI
jgi:hypothetical protein